MLMVKGLASDYGDGEASVRRGFAIVGGFPGRLGKGCSGCNQCSQRLKPDLWNVGNVPDKPGTLSETGEDL
jgi:hypothetical protein